MFHFLIVFSCNNLNVLKFVDLVCSIWIFGLTYIIVNPAKLNETSFACCTMFDLCKLFIFIHQFAKTLFI